MAEVDAAEDDAATAAAAPSSDALCSSCSGGGGCRREIDAGRWGWYATLAALEDDEADMEDVRGEKLPGARAGWDRGPVPCVGCCICRRIGTVEGEPMWDQITS